MMSPEKATPVFLQLLIIGNNVYPDVLYIKTRNLPNKRRKNRNRGSDKVRVQFRKNRENRKRNNNLTREVRESGIDETDYLPEERVSGKGETSRFRTVIQGEDDENASRVVDEEQCLAGRVMSATGLNCIVEAENGEQYECTVRRALRMLARNERNAVVAGDTVLFMPLNTEQGVIERINPRYGTLSRASHGFEHVIVANIDQVIIVASAADPPLKPHLIDRFLVSAEKGGVEPVICINKVDLVDPADLQPVIDCYEQIGYHIFLSSAEEHVGIEHLRAILHQKQSVFAGQSGVGKSSLINDVEPSLQLKTADVSHYSGKGRHTTRRAELQRLSTGGWLVDTPGIRQLELWDVSDVELERWFIEFPQYLPQCKFADCSHSHEMGCGVKQAVELGEISEMRYQSYLKMIAPE